MKKLIMTACLALSSLPCQAEVGSKDMTLAGISDCMKEATNSSAVEDGGDAIVLSCNAEKAKILFNFLGKKVRAEVVQDKNGKFENRPFGNNACSRRIEDSTGAPSNEFRCDLILVIGESLKEYGLIHRSFCGIHIDFPNFPSRGRTSCSAFGDYASISGRRVHLRLELHARGILSFGRVDCEAIIAAVATNTAELAKAVERELPTEPAIGGQLQAVLVERAFPHVHVSSSTEITVEIFWNQGRSEEAIGSYRAFDGSKRDRSRSAWLT